MGKCLLSVAMIVKDEENNIRRALESIKGCVDEIVVVDTGSRDRTPEIVKEYTDKLYFHEWRNDFSEARNYSLKFPTCEWVMVLDADEEASKEFCENIRDFLKSQPPDVNTVFVPTISYLDWDFKRKEFASTARIFRNGTIYYKNIVHNMPVYKPKVVSVPWPIYHYGYIWTRKLRKKKYERTGTLIRKQLQMSKTQEEKLYYLVQLYKTETTGGKLFRKSEVALQTFKELVRAPRIPTIALEFMYYFASDLMNLGYHNEAEKLLLRGVKIDPDYPDLYFGLVGLYEKKKEWEKIIEWGEKFFEVLEKILERMESPRWTVNSIKVTGAASTVIARAHLKLGNFVEATKWIRKAVERSEENGEDIERFLRIFLSDISELKCEDIPKINEAVEFLARYSKENGLKLNISSFIERAVECGVEIPEAVLEGFEPTDEFSKALKERILDGRDHLLDVLTRGRDLRDFIEKTGPNALVFIFDYLVEIEENPQKILKFLNETRSIEDDRVKALSMAFMGDVYLKMGKFKEALSLYRKALDEFPSISRFIKPVVEDLKTVITSDMEGVFEEIYRDHTKGHEFLLNIPQMVPLEWARKLHLVSGSDYAFYTAAVTSNDKEKTRELLLRIKEPDKFPFYYYRLAKTYEGEDWKKAYEYHRKACEENEKLADLKYGVYLYHGLYLSKIMPWMNEKDEVVWAGNISERFSTLDVISPVRMWKKSELGFYYSDPYPVDETLDIFFEKLKGTKFDRLELDVRKLAEIIMKLDVPSMRLSGKGFDEKAAEDFLRSFGIEIDEKSDFLFVPFGLETISYGDFERELDDVKGGIVVFANPMKEDSDVWKYPPFRVIRPYGYLKKLLRVKGFKAIDMQSVKDDFYVMSFSR